MAETESVTATHHSSLQSVVPRAPRTAEEGRAYDGNLKRIEQARLDLQVQTEAVWDAIQNLRDRLAPYLSADDRDMKGEDVQELMPPASGSSLSGAVSDLCLGFSKHSSTLADAANELRVIAYRLD